MSKPTETLPTYEELLITYPQAVLYKWLMRGYKQHQKAIAKKGPITPENRLGAIQRQLNRYLESLTSEQLTALKQAALSEVQGK